jgi:hypothetical protein
VWTCYVDDKTVRTYLVLEHIMMISNENCLSGNQTGFKTVTMPIHDWGPVMNRFLLEYGDRISHE